MNDYRVVKRFLFFPVHLPERYSSRKVWRWWKTVYILRGCGWISDWNIRWADHTEYLCYKCLGQVIP